MDSRKIVLRETAIIAIGELILSAIMVGIFAALDKLNITVILSALGGCLATVGNHFFMAVTVSLAADRAEQGAVEQAKKMVQTSSSLRLLVLAGLMVLGIVLGANVLALLLPLVFTRPTLLLAEFFRKKGDGWTELK